MVLDARAGRRARPVGEDGRALPRRSRLPHGTVGGSVVGSTERVLAMLDEVPGLQLLVDTGHVADWGGDPVELLPYARHVQLRQGMAGSTQLHVDDPRGVVDFAAVVGRLQAPRLRRASARSSTSTSPSRAGPSTTPAPGRSTSPPTSAPTHSDAGSDGENPTGSVGSQPIRTKRDRARWGGGGPGSACLPTRRRCRGSRRWRRGCAGRGRRSSSWS